MRGLVISLVVLLIAGHMLTELSSIMSMVWPSLMSQKVNLFYTGGFEMERWWYVKMGSDDLLLVIVFFVLARVAYRYSVKLFMIALTFVAYHVLDSYMFWYNYKQSHWLYWMLLASVILSILFLVLPIKERSKYKSLI